MYILMRKVMTFAGTTIVFHICEFQYMTIHSSTHHSIPPSVTVPPSVYPSVCRPCWHLTKIKVCNLLTSRIYYKYGEFKTLDEFSVSITVPPFTLIFILPCFKVGMVGGWWEWLVVVVDVWSELCAYCLPQCLSQKY